MSAVQLEETEWAEKLHSSMCKKNEAFLQSLDIFTATKYLPTFPQKATKTPIYLPKPRFKLCWNGQFSPKLTKKKKKSIPCGWNQAHWNFSSGAKLVCVHIKNSWKGLAIFFCTSIVRLTAFQSISWHLFFVFWFFWWGKARRAQRKLTQETCLSFWILHLNV